MTHRYSSLRALVWQVLAAALTLLAAHSAHAEDPRIGQVTLSEGQPSSLIIRADRDMILLLPEGEHVKSIKTGNNSHVITHIPEPREGIILAAVGELLNSELVIQSENYEFHLLLSTTNVIDVPWLVKLKAANDQAADVPASRTKTSYKLIGSKLISPRNIYDDGKKTYIEWEDYQAIPAVFGIEGGRSEELVNGYMRNKVFVIDRVYQELVFRIDKEKVIAQRKSMRDRQ